VTFTEKTFVEICGMY